MYIQQGLNKVSLITLFCHIVGSYCSKYSTNTYEVQNVKIYQSKISLECAKRKNNFKQKEHPYQQLRGPQPKIKSGFRTLSYLQRGYSFSKVKFQGGTYNVTIVPMEIFIVPMLPLFPWRLLLSPWEVCILSFVPIAFEAFLP